MDSGFAGCAGPYWVARTDFATILHRRSTVPTLLRPALRLYATLRPFPVGQLLHWATSRLLPAKLALKPAVSTSRRLWPRNWDAPRWRSAARQDACRFLFLGRAESVTDNWDRAVWPRLWRYHLHYLDDLDAAGVDQFTGGNLLDDWIAHNPPAAGTGWEAYPLSQRIVNSVKLIARGAPSRAGWIESLSIQADALSQQIERHIAANHLFENGKALVFVGSFLTGADADRWLREGLGILDEQCRVQFLDDGGHFELSPMYHGTMLWNLCDLVTLANCSGLGQLAERRPLWHRLVERGLEWYAAMTHPDGGIALFNDAALGAAPDLDTVRSYAQALGIRQPLVTRPPTPQLRNLASSGYLRIDMPGDCAAIIDAAPVGPDCQPGHAHADTLSFELSIGRQRIIVNGGTSTYEVGAARDAQRGTAAHSTVVVDGRNSTDTWAGFRVGRRARPQLLRAERSADGVVVEASHNGYRGRLGGAVHRRRWRFESAALSVLDRIEGRFAHAIAHFHLHPAAETRIDGPSRIAVTLPAGPALSFSVRGGSLSVVDGHWHPRFGASLSNRCLRVAFEGAEIETLITWKLR